MQDFRKLRVWQQAHQLRLDVYDATKRFPSDERFGLTAQLRRSTSSIAANIAEACGYRGGLASARFLYMANGSCCETANHIIAARDLGYLSKERATALQSSLESVRRMLVTLIDRMGARPRISRQAQASSVEPKT